MSHKENYTLEEIDEIVAEYKIAKEPGRSQALELLIKILHPYFLKYVKLLKAGDTSDWDNKDSKEFLSLFVGKKTKNKKSFSEVKKNIAYTLQPYEFDDIYNELTLLLIKLLNQYVKRDGINFLRYYTRYHRYYLRNFIIRISKDPLFHIKDNGDKYVEELEIIDNPPTTNTEYFQEKNPEMFKDEALDSYSNHLTLGWVISCDKWIFKHLTSYQRYLLYLYFARNLGCVNIAKLLGKSKDTITVHLKKIFRKIGKLEAKDQ